MIKIDKADEDYYEENIRQHIEEDEEEDVVEDEKEKVN